VSARCVVEILTMLGEWAIALAIFYEILTRRFNREAAILDDLQATEFFKNRPRLYDAYTQLPHSATVKDRAEAFRQTIWADPELHGLCDEQWAYFCRLGYIHSRTAAEWFPEVIVRFWIMTAGYVREHQRLRTRRFDDHGTSLVRGSFGRCRACGE
jgi:hypothetical protein